MEHDSHQLLQKIKNEVEKQQNSPQALWTSLRVFIIENAQPVSPGLLRNVIDFCIAVYDSFEPNIPFDERDRRKDHVDFLAISLNLQIGEVTNSLSEKDNAFLVKWGFVTSTSMITIRQKVNDFATFFSAFESLATELRQVEHEEEALSIWLYSLYTALFVLAHGTIPAGVLGIASFGIGLSLR